ncbi:MAG: two-component regulator propeller domain-containing protein, partial [Bacteroidota bacterium]
APIITSYPFASRNPYVALFIFSDAVGIDGGGRDIDFKYIDLKNNASTPSVNTYCITKDKQGYIWIATSKGVRRYDGRNTSTLNNKALAEDVLTKVVYQDREGSIWIGTQGDGICRYNYLNDRLECFQNDPNNPSSINHNDILSIYQDSQGRLWVGTEGGLNLFDYATKQFKDYSDLVPHPVLHLQEDQQQHLWIGTWGGGLNLLIPSEYTSSGQQEELLTILPTARTPFALPSPHVWDILFDKDGRMWLAMFDGGIGVMQVPNCDNYYACTPSDFQFIQVDAPNGKYNTPTRNVVYSLAQDQAGYIWIGTLWGTSVLDAKQLAQSDDLSYLQESLRKIPVQTFQPDRKNPTAIADYHIRDIYTDEDGAVWFATLTDLSKYTPPKERFSRKQVVEESPIPIPVDAFYKDSTGQLLVAASNKAIYRYDTISQSHKLVVQDDALNMMDIFAPNLDTIWIGTETDLLYYTSTKGLRKYVLRDAKGEVVSLKNVRCIFECSRGGIWLGTDVGLIWFDPRRKNQQVFQYDSTLKGTISHNMVIDIAEGPDAQLYIATQGGGVNILSLENISPTGFQQLSDIVQGDLSALKSPILSNVAFLGQQLWVGSERGIFQYDLQTKQLYHHDKLNKKIS